MESSTGFDPILLSPEDYATLGEEQFGVPGLVATELIGPFVRIRASGPLIMVHDGVFEAGHGIGHHPHRMNERLFYILQGAVDHDDALNGITGHMGTGDLGRLTEGRRGMLHKEWNNSGGRARAFILVYETDPVPERASFAALRDGEAPRYEEGEGVMTKELVGPRSPLPVRGDIRLFTDSYLEPGARLGVVAEAGEGGLVVPIEGQLAVAQHDSLSPGRAMVLPPARSPRSLSLLASTGARVLRVIHGAGYGLVVADP